MISFMHKISEGWISWLMTLSISMLLLTSCQAWKSIEPTKQVVAQHPIENMDKKDDISEVQRHLPDEMYEPQDDKSSEEDMTVQESESTHNTESEYYVLFKQELSQYLNERIHLFNQYYNAKAGILIFNLNTRDPIVSYHADDCFIPASLTKIVVCSALIQRLRDSNPELNLAESFAKEKSFIQWQGVEFRHLSSLFSRINHYTFKTAPQANRAANSLGKFLQQHDQFTNGSYQTLEDILLSHLDQLSFITPCNRLVNASGLTLNNRLTPFQIADSMFHLKDIPIYQNSLMRAGEGTLKNRLNTIAKMHRFKTGSLKRSGVLCLAAFLDFSEPVGVVIMINQMPSHMFSKGGFWIDETIQDVVRIAADHYLHLRQQIEREIKEQTNY